MLAHKDNPQRTSFPKIVSQKARHQHNSTCCQFLGAFGWLVLNPAGPKWLLRLPTGFFLSLGAIVGSGSCSYFVSQEGQGEPGEGLRILQSVKRGTLVHHRLAIHFVLDAQKLASSLDRPTEAAGTLSSALPW